MVRAMKRAIAAAAILLTWVPAAHAEPEAWGEGARAAVRLLAAGVSSAGVLEGAVEIVLPEGWHTYWRSPGDAGIAPVFDFTASRNVGPVSVSFPAPARFDDGVSVSNIYEDTVILPLTAAVQDVSRPVELVLSVELGVCAQVCVPDKAEAALTVEPGTREAAAAAAIADVRARLPGKPEPGAVAVESAARAGGTDKRPAFRITARVPSPASADMFVEGPEDWAPYKPELVASDGATGVWTVKFSRLGALTPLEGAALRVTIVDGERAIEQTVPLDAALPVR